MIFEYPWVKDDITEGYGQVWINKKDDCMVIDYKTKLKVFINRKEYTIGYLPCFFTTCLEVLK
jgi:hypothetical protein